MTKAEARERFFARAALAGNPPVGMMAVGGVSMTEYADIELDSDWGWRESLVVETEDEYVRLRVCGQHAVLGRADGERLLAFDAKHLDAVIDALIRIRDERAEASK